MSNIILFKTKSKKKQSLVTLFHKLITKFYENFSNF